MISTNKTNSFVVIDTKEYKDKMHNTLSKISNAINTKNKKIFNIEAKVLLEYHYLSLSLIKNMIVWNPKLALILFKP
jgi:3-methyladenine DNA glycosylase AlkD